MKTTEALSALTVNEIIRQHPRTVGVFKRHGIDACCGGGASVADAAARHGADADALLVELQRVIGGGMSVRPPTPAVVIAPRPGG